MEVVTEFRGPYAFLSNFFSPGFMWRGRYVKTREHAFQSEKTKDFVWRKRILGAMSPGRAKRLGRQCPLDPRWEEIKLDVMEAVVRAFFEQNPVYRDRLLATGDVVLIEGNRWHDTFWGMDLDTGMGKNHLGHILMELREVFALNQRVSECGLG